MPLRSHLKRLSPFLKSAAIICYLVYAFWTGTPSLLRVEVAHFFSINSLPAPNIFPWWPWGMFQNGSPWHQELTARGATAGGAITAVDLEQFFPPTNHLVLEGNRVSFGIRNKIQPNSNLAKALCTWVLNRHNKTQSDASRLETLSLFFDYWPLPPDMRQPPKYETQLIQCRIPDKRP
jgi:hypothetical protein